MKTQKNNVATKTYIFDVDFFDSTIETVKLQRKVALKESDKDRYMYFSGILFVLEHIDLYLEEK